MIAGNFRDFDRKADLAVYRSSNGITSLLKSAGDSVHCNSGPRPTFRSRTRLFLTT